MRLIPRNRLKFVSKTTTYTATTDDDVIFCSDAGGSWTLSLPPASICVNKVYWIKKTNDSANVITVDANSTETIDDALTIDIFGEDDVLCIMSDGANWKILQRPPGGELILTQGNGLGSNNTAIRRFLTTTKNTASLDLTYADSATNGMSITIVRAGLYAIEYMDTSGGSGGTAFGITLNSNQLTTGIGMDSFTRAVTQVDGGGSITKSMVAIVIALRAADVIRAHVAAAGDAAWGSSGNVRFIMRRIR